MGKSKTQDRLILSLDQSNQISLIERVNQASTHEIMLYSPGY